MSATPLTDRLALDGLTIPDRSAHRFGAPWRPSPRLTPTGDVRIGGGLVMSRAAFEHLSARAGMIGPDVAVTEYLAQLGEAWGFPYDALRARLLGALAAREGVR